jgi:hypothetical protein
MRSTRPATNPGLRPRERVLFCAALAVGALHVAGWKTRRSLGDESPWSWIERTAFHAASIVALGMVAIGAALILRSAVQRSLPDLVHGLAAVGVGAVVGSAVLVLTPSWWQT